MKANPKVPYATVHQALQRDPRFQALETHLNTLTRLQGTLDAGWPQLRLKVRNLKDGGLSLTAPSAAQAARLRQIEPSLLAALQSQAPQVTRITFKPQTRSLSVAGATEPKRSISENTLKVISEQNALICHPKILEALQKLKQRARKSKDG